VPILLNEGTPTMYVPAAFREERVAILHEAIDECGLATLVTAGSDGLFASHLPMLLDPEPAPYGTLIGHVAAANPHARTEGPALAIFLGPNAYVSPNWYPSKREHGRVVPTWNYVAVHAYGELRTFDDPERLRALVERLTERNERRQPAPWHVDDAPDDFVADMLKGIVGVALPVTRLEGKRKMSQNRPPADREGVIAGLRAESAMDSDAVADIVETILGAPDR
jgi:transcriptional regulator